MSSNCFFSLFYALHQKSMVSIHHPSFWCLFFSVGLISVLGIVINLPYFLMHAHNCGTVADKET